MRAGKTTCLWLIGSITFIAAFGVHADTVNYILENVILDDSTQMNGTFSWTYTIGDFENGIGQFISLDIPYTSHDHTDLNATIDAGQSIEITLEGSVHDDGVDITLVLSQALTPTTGSLINLLTSKYEIGGNGFHTGVFKNGRISPVNDDVVFRNGFE